MRRLSFIVLLLAARMMMSQEPKSELTPPMKTPPSGAPAPVPAPPMPAANGALPTPGPGAMPGMPGSGPPSSGGALSIPALPTSAPTQPAPASPGDAKSQMPAPSTMPPAMTPAAQLPPAAKSEDPAKRPGAPVVAESGPVIPQPFPRDRYEASWKKNPFLLKTAPVIQTKESWATDYALTSVAKMGGKYRVSIKNKKTGESKRLTQGDDGGEFKIVSVNLKPDRKSTSVEVEKGGEKAALTYDPTMTTAAPRGAVPGVPGMARPGMPTIPGAPTGAVPMPTVRTSSTGGATAGGSMTGNTAMNRASGTAPASYGGGGGGPSYSGNAYGGGGFVGGIPSGAVGNAGGTAASPSPAVGAPASRLGALGPQAGAASNNGLVPMVGGTRVTTTSGGTATDISISDPGNIVPATTNAASTNTPSTVTRRRTLIPAPVVTQ